MTTNEVAIRYEVAVVTARKWAKQDGKIKRKMATNGVMEYNFTEADCKRFEKRPRPGWKKGRLRKD